MLHLPPSRVADPATDTKVEVPHRAILGMNVDDARWHLAVHGLKLVVVMRDGAEMPAADLQARHAVWVAVRGTKVDSVLART